MIAANTIVGGRYRVIRPLGGGGMKLVYLAEDLRLAARPCALAEMVDSFTDPDMQRQAVAAFQREADMLAQLSNEHIPRIHDRFSEQNRHYLVMEFVDGQTLEDELKRGGGRLDEARVIDAALQVLDTLGYLHSLVPPVIYRDLKPSNLMLARNGQVKLIDFGIARFFQPQSNATMIGTQGYAPPEQYRGRAEARSDLYALGATMHHALSGRDPAAEPPFSFPKLRALRPGIHPALADLVDQALEYEVVHRMADAAEFKQRLLAIKAGTPVPAAARDQKAAPPQPPGRSQLKLPLGQGAPPLLNAAPDAATVLMGGSEALCGTCGRAIPADSRFCSFCGVHLGSGGPGQATSASPEAATGPLPGSAPSAPDPPQWQRRSPPLRFITVLIAAAAVLVLGATSLVTYLREERRAPGYEMAGPPYAPGFPPAPGSGPIEPRHTSPRAIMLRRVLDAAGYGSVHFRLDGDTAILWGTVPSEIDRITIQTMVFAAGVYSLEDHLAVSGRPFAGIR